MNRRGLLALLGGTVAAPSILGAKTAAAIMGVNPNSPAHMPLSQGVGVAGSPVNGFWGSPASIAIEASREARYEIAQNDRYAHMKSWGQGFRHSVISRERQIELIFDRRCREDDAFLAKLMEVFK